MSKTAVLLNLQSMKEFSSKRSNVTYVRHTQLKSVRCTPCKHGMQTTGNNYPGKFFTFQRCQPVAERYIHPPTD